MCVHARVDDNSVQRNRRPAALVIIDEPAVRSSIIDVN
jgi:hypothetical protein